MKNLTLFMGLCLVLMFASCTKEAANEEGILGSWNMEEFTSTGTTVQTTGPAVVTTDISIVGVNLDLTINFEETKYTSDGSLDIETTTVILGQSNTQTTEGPNSTETGTYVVDGNVLRLTGSNGDVVEHTITKLSDNELILESNQMTLEDFGAIKIESDIDIYQRFTR